MHALDEIARDVMAQEGDEWFGQHKLVLVRAVDESAFEAALLELPEGVHPGEALVGMSCPPMVLAVGVAAYGWAALAAGGTRPSQAEDRQRVRVVHLVDRLDRSYAIAELQDGRTVTEPAEGPMVDALRGALGLARHQLD